MFPLASFLFSLAGLTIATYTDFRDRTIPNWVSLGMVVLGVLLAAYESYTLSSFSPLAWSVGIVVATYIVSYGLWKLGAWAGGDVKLFTGLAALNPFNSFVLGSLAGVSFMWGEKNLLFPSMFPFFMLNLFMVSVVMLIPYTGFLSVGVLHHVSRRAEFFSVSKKAIVDSVVYALILLGLSALLEYFSLSPFLVLPLLIVFSFLPSSVRWVAGICSIVALFLSWISWSAFVSIFAVLVVVSLIFSWYGFAQRHVLTKSKKISALKDGDIPGEWIILQDGKICRDSPGGLKTIIKASVERDWVSLMHVISGPTGKILASPRQAAGLYLGDIALLQKEVAAGRLSDEIKVKASAPFAPAVLLAYVVLTLLGDGPLSWWFG